MSNQCICEITDSKNNMRLDTNNNINQYVNQYILLVTIYNMCTCMYTL